MGTLVEIAVEEGFAMQLEEAECRPVDDIVTVHKKGVPYAGGHIHGGGLAEYSQDPIHQKHVSADPECGEVRVDARHMRLQQLAERRMVSLELQPGKGGASSTAGHATCW